MTGKIVLLDSEKITYEGIFDMGEFYKHVYEWLAWRKYDVSEKKYKEKIKPAGKEMEIVWSAGRDLDEYSAFKIDVQMLIIGLNDVEVQKNGAKIKMQKGEITIYVSAYIATDRQDFWVSRPQFAFLQKFYEKYLYRSAIETMKGELWKQGWDFFNECKAFLNLYKF